MSETCVLMLSNAKGLFVKYNRTNFESSSPDKVLDGDIDEFLEQSLYKLNEK